MSYQFVIDLSSTTSFHAACSISLYFVRFIAIFFLACYTIILSGTLFSITSTRPYYAISPAKAILLWKVLQRIILNTGFAEFNPSNAAKLRGKISLMCGQGNVLYRSSNKVGKRSVGVLHLSTLCIHWLKI